MHTHRTSDGNDQLLCTFQFEVLQQEDHSLTLTPLTRVDSSSSSSTPTATKRVPPLQQEVLQQEQQEVLQQHARLPPANDDICSATPITFAPGSNVMEFAGIDVTAATVESGEVEPGVGSDDCFSQDGWCSPQMNATKSVWFVYYANDSCMY